MIKNENPNATSSQQRASGKVGEKGLSSEEGVNEVFGISGLPISISKRSARGLKYAADYAERAQVPVDSVLLLAGYLTVRKDMRYDTCKFLSEYLAERSEEDNHSPVTLLGLTGRYGISSASSTQGSIPPSKGIDSDARIVLKRATQLAKKVSGRTIIAARHILVSMCLHGKQVPKVQGVLTEQGYDLDSLRRDLIERVVAFNLENDNAEAWQDLLSQRVAHRFVGTHDEPAKKDSLGRGHLVDTLAAMFRSQEQATPFTLAILGDWGVGKTSVMEQVKDQLKDKKFKDHFKFAWFNAWEYEQCEDMRAGLAQEVVKGLTDGLCRPGRWWLIWRYALKEHRLSLVKALFLLLVAIAGVVALMWVPQVRSNPYTQGLAGTTAGGALILFIAFVNKHMKPIIEHPLVVELTTYLKLPAYGRHLGMIPVMKRQLGSLCDFMIKEGQRRRLVVFVDDLDRCGPKGIMETLEAVRLVMNMKGIIVVIALDHRIALRAIAAHYAEHYEKLDEEFFRDRQLHRLARDYLGKIIQLPIRLSTPPEAQMRRFTFELFDAVKEVPTDAADPERVNEKNKSEHPGDVVPNGAKRGTADKGGGADDATDPLGAAEASGSKEDRKKIEQLLVDVGKDTAEERDLFADLTVEYAVANPRRLKRLFNAYRLLRTLDELVAMDGVLIPADASRRNMTMLFWLDYIYELNREQALTAAEYLLNPIQGEAPESLPADAKPKVAEMRELFAVDDDHGAGYRRTAGRVRRLILPHFDETTSR